MSDLPTVLPPNAQSIELTLEQLSARLQGMADPVAALWDAEICPEHLLGYLAWALSVEVWDPAWSENERRRVLIDAVQVHRVKGTIGAVRRALEGIGFRTDIREWFETGDDPHTFRIEAFGEDVFAGGFAINVALLEMITDILDNVKPERSHFTLRIGETFESDAYLRNGSRQKRFNRLDLEPQPRAHLAENPIYARSSNRSKRIDVATHLPSTRSEETGATIAARSAVRLRRISSFTHDFEVTEGEPYVV